MKAGVVTVESNAPIIEAVKLMRVSKVGGLPVLENGTLVGICTRSDLLDHLYVFSPHLLSYSNIFYYRIRILEPIPPAEDKTN